MAWVIGIGIFLFLLFAFPRAIVGLIVLCGVIIGGALLWDKIKTDERARLRAAVTVTVAHDLEQCSPEYPLFVRINNGSENTVEKVSFGVDGNRAGYSDPIYESDYQGYSSDKIIARGDSWSTCWTLPRTAYGTSEQMLALHLPETLVWTVKNISPRFNNP
jgi:hypothetical protein